MNAPYFTSARGEEYFKGHSSSISSFRVAPPSASEFDNSCGVLSALKDSCGLSSAVAIPLANFPKSSSLNPLFFVITSLISLFFSAASFIPLFSSVTIFEYVTRSSCIFFPHALNATASSNAVEIKLFLFFILPLLQYYNDPIVPQYAEVEHPFIFLNPSKT